MGVPQIEVTFDIDANGIVNVNAKDLATNKEQKMTITGGTALSSDDIDRMVKDAESYAEEDAKRREAVETRNQAEQLVNQTDKLIEESGEQMTDDEKTSVEAAKSALTEVLGDADAEADDIRAKMDELVSASQAMATRLYQQAASQQEAAGTEGDSTEDDEVVEAEIVDDEDE
jgi:molecular chaperone DnaK